MGFRGSFRRLRVERGYTQKQMAELLGADLRTIQRWEAGDRTPYMAQLVLEKVKSLPEAKEPRAGSRGPMPRRKKSRRPED